MADSSAVESRKRREEKEIRHACNEAVAQRAGRQKNREQLKAQSHRHAAPERSDIAVDVNHELEGRTVPFSA